MDKRGFTLIEVIVVIAILGMLSVIVTISLTSTLDNTNQNTCNRFVTEVEEAACVYAALSNKEVVCNRSNCEPIPLKYLVEEGLIKSLKDGCTNSDIDLSETVTVTWDENGEKNCKYNGVKKYEG